LETPFHDQRIIEFSDHMEAIRENGGVIKFSDIDLMDLYKLAPFIVIYNREQSGRLKIRFVGTAITQQYDQDVTGTYLDELNIGPNSDKLAPIYEQLIENQLPQWMFITAESPEDITLNRKASFYAYERLAYPLRNDTGDITNIISLVALQSITSAPIEFKHIELD
jgi:hypothetical protein